MTITETFYPRGRKPRTVVNPQDHKHLYSPKIASLLGHMTIHWAALEFQIQTLLWVLTENPEIGSILSRKLGMARWLDDIALVARYRIADEAVMQELLDLIAQIHRVGAKRNNYVHHLFAVTSESGSIFQAKSGVTKEKGKRRFKTDLRKIKTAELDSLIKEMHALKNAVAVWEVTHVTQIGSKNYRLPPLRHSL